jgi:uncharacterized protein YjiS (DUF1127 family)
LDLATVLQRLLKMVVDADVRHRQRCRLDEMPDERLRDMGLPRRGLPFSLPAAPLR